MSGGGGMILATVFSSRSLPKEGDATQILPLQAQSDEVLRCLRNFTGSQVDIKKIDGSQTGMMPWTPSFFKLLNRSVSEPKSSWTQA